jgi:hypothetical protein
MKAVLVVCAAALTAGAATPASALSSAATQATPEIQRGAAAAYDCYLRFSALTQAAAFAGCVQDVHASNQKSMGEGYEAFDAGLYFRAAQFIRIKVEVLQDGDPTNSKIAVLTSVLEPLAADCDAADAKLHVSYDDVREILVPQ